MGRKKGWAKVEDGNEKVTSPKFTQQPPHPCSSLESQCLGLNEGPGGIVGTLPQRAQGYWDWSGKEWGTGRGGVICVFVCRCGSGFCLCYWSSFWKVKHLGRAVGVTVGKMIVSYLFLDVCQDLLYFLVTVYFPHYFPPLYIPSYVIENSQNYVWLISPNSLIHSFLQSRISWWLVGVHYRFILEKIFFLNT